LLSALARLSHRYFPARQAPGVGCGANQTEPRLGLVIPQTLSVGSGACQAQPQMSLTVFLAQTHWVWRWPDLATNGLGSVLNINTLSLVLVRLKR